jgi:DNA-binding beta-propeller fold protein YncE
MQRGTTHNEPPLFTIRGEKTKLVRPLGIALDPHDNIYVANEGLGADHDGTITVYPACSNGNVAPVAIHTKSWPRGFAMDSSGNIYVLILTGPWSGKGNIVIYPPGRGDHIAPIARIRGVNFNNTWNDVALAWHGLALD